MSDEQSRMERELRFYVTTFHGANIPFVAKRVTELDRTNPTYGSVKKALHRAATRLSERGIISLQKWDGMIWCFLEKKASV